MREVVCQVAESRIGARLRQLRLRAGLSQSDVCRAAGVPLSSLRNWESGRREPLLSAAARVAAAIGVDVGALVQPLDDEPAAAETFAQSRPAVRPAVAAPVPKRPAPSPRPPAGLRPEPEEGEDDYRVVPLED